MRRSGWLIPVPAFLLWILCVGYPFACVLGALVAGGDTDVPVRATGRLLLTSVVWSLAVAVGAGLVGWLPGRLLGRLAGRRAFVAVAVLLLAPVCLPAYVVFFAWWQAWPADSAIYRWAVEHELIGTLRAGTLYAGLVCWSWPLVAWCTAGATSAVPARQEEMLRLDGAGFGARLRAAWAGDAPGLLVGALVVAVVTFGNTTCFDLALIFTFANELRAIRADGADAAQVLQVAAPAVSMTVAAAILVWWAIQRRPAELARRAAAPRRSLLIVAALIWTASVLIPLTLLTANLRRSEGIVGQIAAFLDFYGTGLRHTAAVSATAGVLAAAVALGLAALWQDHRRWVRGTGHVIAIGWLAAAVVPALVVTVGLEAAYNVPFRLWPLGFGAAGSEGRVADVIYRQPLILVLGLLARFGVIGALWGRWLARREPAPLRDQRRLDGATTLTGALATTWPRLIVAATGALAIVFALALSELPIVVHLQPPGFEAIATSILNDLHYQRPQTVMVATLLFMAAALLGAAVVILGLVALPRPAVRAAAAVAIIGLGGVFAGCDAEADGPSPLRPRLTFGAPGRSLGQFSYPRGIAVDRERERVFIVDKTARVQRFGFDGKPQTQWEMPEREDGKPTGLNVAPDGRVFVADTHYFRVIVYDADGREQHRFGEYGDGPGQFTFPTDVVVGPQDRLYVSEYGGNDRVQVFSPEGDYQFEFGGYGPEVGQFDRPQSMVFNDDLTELYITDACNHRIVVVDPEGDVLRTFGEFGRERGRLAYPYDLMILDDGSLLVCEFGNNRLQRFTTDGRSLGVYGRTGPGPGELQYPWGVDGVDDRIFVLDSGNHRVQLIKAP